MWKITRGQALTPSWLTTSLCLLILAVLVPPAQAATVVSETIWGTAGSDGSAAVAVAAVGAVVGRDAAAVDGDQPHEEAAALSGRRLAVAVAIGVEAARPGRR